MQLIRQTIEPGATELPEVELVADRFKLQKRRWRGQAEDGADFGFELAEPLGHGAFFFESPTHRYRIRQTSESVLAIRLAGDATEAAETGWQIGNLHMPDRKSTRLNSSHVVISYAVFCLIKKTTTQVHLHYLSFISIQLI